MTDPKPLTERAIREIRERLEKATPGPWTWIHDMGRRHILDSAGLEVCRLLRLAHRERKLNIADARFIAHAPEDIRRLLAEIERLRVFRRHSVAMLEKESRREDGGEGA